MEKGDVHDRLSVVCDTIRSVAADYGQEDTRVQSLLASIESNLSELRELMVVKRGIGGSNDSGNASFAEVCCDSYSS